MQWIGKNLIMHDGVILETDDCEDGWSAVRAIENYERKKKRELIGALRNLSEEEKAQILR